MAIVTICEAKLSVDDLREALREQGWRLLHESELKLATLERYIERFHELSGEFETYEAAFEALEDEYFELFGVNRFANYNSFRTSGRVRRIKRRGRVFMKS